MAVLHLNHILTCNSGVELYHYLDRCPTGLDKLYDQAWERATGDKESLVSQRAKLILMWVFVAVQPLSAATLAEALSAPKRNHGVATLLTEEELVAACAGLVRIERRQWFCPSIVSLSHLSVQEYLEKNRHVYFPDADDPVVASALYHLGSKRLYRVLSPLHGVYLYAQSFF